MTPPSGPDPRPGPSTPPSTPAPLGPPLPSASPTKPIARLRLLALALAVTLCGSSLASAQAPLPVAATSPMGVLLPDAEFVFGPSLYDWDTEAFIQSQRGFLARYFEPVGDEVLSGAAIVTRVAEDYSVGPRMLLTLIEMKSGWVTQVEPADQEFAVDGVLPGLFAGLATAADQLNAAFYAHRFEDQRQIPGIGSLPEANGATFALLSYLQRDTPAEEWAALQAPSRFYSTWMQLFGDPYLYEGSELLPEPIDFPQPALPYAEGELWFYVGGPQSPWGAGGPPAAIHFAPPPAQAVGCIPTTAWVRAVAPGLVVRSRASGVVVDLDEDGFEGTGWVHVYAHLAGFDRVAVGTRVSVGDPLGHPSCEGGLQVQTQTRVSFARKLQGVWMSIDQAESPLELGRWLALQGDRPGEGWMVRPGIDQARPAQAAKDPAVNGIPAFPPDFSP